MISTYVDYWIDVVGADKRNVTAALLMIFDSCSQFVQEDDSATSELDAKPAKPLPDARFHAPIHLLGSTEQDFDFRGWSVNPLWGVTIQIDVYENGRSGGWKRYDYTDETGWVETAATAIECQRPEFDLYCSMLRSDGLDAWPDRLISEILVLASLLEADEEEEDYDETGDFSDKYLGIAILLEGLWEISKLRQNVHFSVESVGSIPRLAAIIDLFSGRDFELTDEYNDAYDAFQPDFFEHLGATRAWLEQNLVLSVSPRAGKGLAVRQAL